MITKKDLECEIKELQLEIEEKAKVIGKLKDYLNQREYQLKQMKKENNSTEMTVEELQSKNWYVNMSEMRHFIREDENTVRIEGVKYQKVGTPRPKTLYDTLAQHSFVDGFHFNEQQRGWICDTVADWMTKPDDIQPPLYADGWNDCLKYLRKNIK